MTILYRNLTEYDLIDVWCGFWNHDGLCLRPAEFIIKNPASPDRYWFACRAHKENGLPEGSQTEMVTFEVRQSLGMSLAAARDRFLVWRRLN